MEKLGAKLYVDVDVFFFFFLTCKSMAIWGLIHKTLLA